ncbi:hypothetical protein ABZ894_33480 [Nocardia beijingensis]
MKDLVDTTEMYLRTIYDLEASHKGAANTQRRRRCKSDTATLAT